MTEIADGCCFDEAQSDFLIAIADSAGHRQRIFDHRQRFRLAISPIEEVRAFEQRLRDAFDVSRAAIEGFGLAERCECLSVLPALASEQEPESEFRCCVGRIECEGTAERCRSGVRVFHLLGQPT